MWTIFESREAAGAELYAMLTLERDALVYALTPEAIEVAYALVLRSGSVLRQCGSTAPVAGRAVWLVDDGDSPLECVARALVKLRAGRPRRLYLAAPVMRRDVRVESLIDGLYKVYWAAVVSRDARLYRFNAPESKWFLTSMSAARAWEDRWPVTDKSGTRGPGSRVLSAAPPPTPPP